jgi:hypothetical protein
MPSDYHILNINVKENPLRYINKIYNVNKI